MPIKINNITVIDDNRAANVVSITGLTTALSVAQGGTGATSASTARTSLGLVIGTDVLSPTGSAASLTSFPTLNQNTSGTAAGLSSTLAIGSGGTGSTTASGARTALGLAIGTDVLAPNGSGASLSGVATVGKAIALAIVMGG